MPQAIWNNWCAMMVLSLTGLGEGGETLTEQWINILGLSAILTGPRLTSRLTSSLWPDNKKLKY